MSVKEIANLVVKIAPERVVVDTAPTDDIRSYHISSELIKNELGFELKFNVSDAIHELFEAFADNKINDGLVDDKYSNIKTMKLLKLV